MVIDIKSIGRKLRQARELQSQLPEDVGKATGISHEKILLIESGEARPSGDEVLILANHYKHDFRDFLLNDRPEPFKEAEILYRRHGSSFTSKDRRAIQEFLYLCEIEADLEREIGIKKIEFSHTPQGTFVKAHGEPAARELRKLLGYKQNEIPRDIYTDFRNIGIHIFRRRLANPDISGLFIEHPRAGHCVLVNYDEDIYRQRFSVCHEAAHAIFDSKDSVIVSFRPKSSNFNIKDLQEIRANRFASCYLMPPDKLPDLSRWTSEEAIKWAQELRVSTTALAIALQQARLINESTARIIKSAKVPRSNKIDPEAPINLTEQQRTRRLALLERGLSDYYVGLCFDAHQGGLISAGRLSEALLATHAETREISILYGRSINNGS
jgi:Zn-dependent peptidase ImmA (M78 family)/transcriptional regulator with XRE-family HTH domain